MLAHMVCVRLVVAPYCRLDCMRLTRGAINRYLLSSCELGIRAVTEVLALHRFDG